MKSGCLRCNFSHGKYWKHNSPNRTHLMYFKIYVTIICFWSTPFRCGPCLIKHAWNSGIAYSHMYHHPWTTIRLMRYMVQSLYSKYQGNIWVCMRYSWRSCRDLFVDPSLLDIVHASYDTHRIARYHIHTCIIILGPLHHCWWRPWFKLLFLEIRVTAEYVQDCSSRSCDILWCDPSLSDLVLTHITLMKQCDSISIHVLLSLDHYTTDEVHDSSSLYVKPGSLLSIYGVYFVVLLWSMGWFTPISRNPCLM